MCTYETRQVAQMERARKCQLCGKIDCPEVGHIILEGDAFRDRLFATCGFLNGSFTVPQFSNYLRMWTLFNNQIETLEKCHVRPAVEAFVYLAADPKVCYERVHHKRKRQGEAVFIYCRRGRSCVYVLLEEYSCAA